MRDHHSSEKEYNNLNKIKTTLRAFGRHKKQKEEDIAICECKYDISQPESACGETCLNVLTSTECTPGFCLCGYYCKNQRFQKCEYAKTKLFKTENRGWGLLADEDIKKGQFVIEYCGEVISWKEAKRRSQAYEIQGVRDAFIISLNASETIDATRKGSLARFINHSCQPNCETRKWNVLGEVRVGIFARQDIAIGTELAYNYNFEWYGGAKVRCLCGAASCSGFLGAKSRGFQEDTYLWEDDDDRYSVEKIPLYDSAEDEPSKLLNTMIINSSSSEYNVGGMTGVKVDSENQFLSTSFVVQSLDSVPMDVVNETKAEVNEESKLCSQDTEEAFLHKNGMISRIQSSNVSQKYQIGPKSVPKKRSKKYPNGRTKNLAQKQVDAKAVALLLPTKEAQEEVLKYEEMKNDVTSQLESLYDEIRPAIEEHERDNQDSVATSVAEKWIEASCMKLKAEFDLYFSIVKNFANTPPRAYGQAKPFEVDNQTEINYLTN
ncbi:Histone-lysine N-methyltransferase ASHH1 [Morus notabilis]|uniref:Histone-lysine N-methyltransferase ASHH1 n=1 Tax=Morus notabilis TaxID=981085 RepID=W9RME6_9ROSA|nr:Histone-lysine N-methyltransferase ASHH1 [Morus notabilis]